MPREFQESTWRVKRAFWDTFHAETESPVARRSRQALEAVWSAMSMACLGFCCGGGGGVKASGFWGGGGKGHEAFGGGWKLLLCGGKGKDAPPDWKNALGFGGAGGRGPPRKRGGCPYIRGKNDKKEAQ